MELRARICLSPNPHRAAPKMHSEDGSGIEVEESVNVQPPCAVAGSNDSTFVKGVT